MQNIDSKLIYEAYINEGLLDRAKAHVQGVARTAKNALNAGKEKAAGLKAATGSLIGNQQMAQQGAQQVQQAQQARTQNAQQTQTNKIDTVKSGFTGKVDKELINFSTQLSKILNVADPSQALGKLKEMSPELTELYTQILNLSKEIKNV